MTIFADVCLVGAKGRKIYASPKLICRASSCFIGIRIDSCVIVKFMVETVLTTVVEQF